MSDLTGQRIAVTGGASGMGAALLAPLAAAGARVVSLDRSEAAGRAAAEAAGIAGFVACDVSDKGSVDAAFAESAALLGGLDTLVHAAGIAPASPAEDITVEAWDQIFAVNARGTLLTNQAAFRLIRDGNGGAGGRILNFASGAGVSGLPNKAHYSATKGAVVAWSRTAAKEWGKHNVTVNMIAPAIATPMYAKTRSEMSPQALAALDARLATDMPIDGRLGDPERDFVPLMLFLCSPGARFLTGQIYAIDGGLLMVR
ncbi:SDR family NAD(P)-dependent oxidoreductase [Sphingomonas immobilis]|uniref:SDR family oxidoreductase n=1 Tax=Sphingomonas immobilis TaxID=3063997 RepID=A0ABT8ZZR4_9SPHN|nr:SDR family oxidoreductase [Sphingomonas sp. CA1-15]MDO7842241.1 SDR family oxidoreductase [Sphingomonas sp. CA1-15]